MKLFFRLMENDLVTLANRREKTRFCALLRAQNNDPAWRNVNMPPTY